MNVFIILLILIDLQSISGLFNPGQVLEIPQGKLRGLENRRRDYVKYLSIPYATFVGRYQNPGPPPLWDGIFNATRGNVFCAQLHKTMVPIGDEDCLTLNIYSPGQISYKKLLPVIVYIHGGGFMSGSSNELIYNPEPIVRKNVIVVVINYRVGAFGFLCLKVKGAPGNAGLKDQVAALQWVNKNIQTFGGDPQSVTIVGASAGGASVNYLMMSREARDLFHRAMIESGTAFSPFGFAQDPIERAALVASKLGYNTKNPFELLNIFTNASKADIINASIIEGTVDPMKRYIFRPCVEKQILGGYPFITKTPKQIMESGDYNKVPVIVGYNDKEGIMDESLLDDNLYQELEEHLDDTLPDNMVFTGYDQKSSLLKDLRDFYFQDNALDKSMADSVIDYFSDAFYMYPAVVLTRYLLRDNKHPVFNYYFQYSSRRNIIKIMNGSGDKKGASHGDEVFYMFEPIGLFALPKSKKDAVLINRMTTMWTNFARTGDPTSIRSSVLPLKWSASDNQTLRFLIIDETLQMDTLPNPDRIEFWQTKYSNYGIITQPRNKY
ncbi:unnamed protein product [Plutella xylostella]|uniref:Carboxylic ester hydrolase n=1 Tax=Plutella xylostella TaxID=51655 RepID=A0A8S4EU17_PLUXY|nr:unnamed protein product [Plutella xylostella]